MSRHKLPNLRVLISSIVELDKGRVGIDQTIVESVLVTQFDDADGPCEVGDFVMKEFEFHD
jgi:hypothetical protein